MKIFSSKDYPIIYMSYLVYLQISRVARVRCVLRGSLLETISLYLHNSHPPHYFLCQERLKEQI
jgi:hypothetical protein